jgi:hypothetical protein
MPVTASTVAAATDCPRVHLFDLRGTARVYTRLSPTVGKLVVVPHGGDAARRDGAARGIVLAGCDRGYPC